MRELRQLRKLAGMTQIELSRRTGIDRAKLSFAENGYVTLTANERTTVMRAISKAAETNAAKLRDVGSRLEDRVLTPATA